MQYSDFSETSAVSGSYDSIEREVKQRLLRGLSRQLEM